MRSSHSVLTSTSSSGVAGEGVLGDRDRPPTAWTGSIEYRGSVATAVASHLQGSGTNTYYGGTTSYQREGKYDGERSEVEVEREREREGCVPLHLPGWV